MGTDIHSCTEVRNSEGEWEHVAFRPFNWRSYHVYGFIANVRNMSSSPVISPRRGLPDDVTQETRDDLDWGYHSITWLSLKELLDYNYEQVFEDLRVMAPIPQFPHASYTVKEGEPGEGTPVVLREFLGESFFKDLSVLQRLGSPEDVRIVFGFDS